MITVILLQLFWLSFACIGLAVFMAGKRLRLLKTNSGTLTLLNSLHPLVELFVYTATGLALFAPPIAVGYIFELPLQGYVYFYLFILSISVFVLWYERRAVFALLWHKARLSRREWLILGVLLGLIVAEYATALRAGGSLGDDTIDHLVHIQSMANFGYLSFTGPFTGYNGVIDLRYSANLLNALQAMATTMLHVPAYKIWFYSFAFYRLLLSLSLFSLLKTYFGQSIPKEWPYYIVLMVPYFCYTYVYDNAELPHNIAMAFTALILIGLRYLFVKGNPLLFLLGVLLVAATHGLTSTYTLAFLGLLLIVLVAFHKAVRYQVIVLLVAIALLIVPAVASYTQHSPQSSGSQPAKEGHGLHAIDIYTKKKGPIVWPKFILVDGGRFARHEGSTKDYVALPIDIWAIGGYILILGYVLLVKRIRSDAIKRVSLLLLALLSLAIFNSLYMSTLSYAYLIRKTKNKAVRLTIILTVFFFAIIAYNPIVLTVVFGRLPLWIVARFEDFNTFMFIAPLLGVFLAYRWVARYWKIASMATGFSLFIVMLIANYGLVRFPLNSARAFSLNQEDYANNVYSYKIVSELSQLDTTTRNQIVYTDDASVSDWLPIASSGQIGEVANYYENQQSDYVKRLNCSNNLQDKLVLTDLEAAHVNRVVLDSGGKLRKSQHETLALASQKPYLILIQRTARYSVYNVRYQSTSPKELHSSTCFIPPGQ